jgi:alginate O-acetyltransferase complex protein AlgI
MLFNSGIFICIFLPVTFLGFVLATRVDGSVATLWLVVCSFIFYGYWRPSLLSLISISILGNYCAGKAILAFRDRDQHVSNVILFVAVTLNLALIGYFKYYNFFLTSLVDFNLLTIQPQNVVLPIGISFYTFTQIAYLVDARRGLVSDPSFLKYVLFVSYFPHLIAGPILHHAEMIPQFRGENYSPSVKRVAIGLSVFVIGLAKKIVLADSIAPYANAVFELPNVTASEAWGGVLAYSLQIYFDFSGYCDMAIGLSYIFGVRLPLNFNSPYKATSIIEFWRRWHMTLSRFLRDYVYFPLGGNRRGSFRRYTNLLLTMAIGGLWHGAGWTFVIWGILHGFYLVVNHLWRAVADGLGVSESAWWRGTFGLPLTFACVAVAWVFFRAKDFDTAADLIYSMAGRHGWVPDNWFFNVLSYWSSWELIPRQPGVIAGTLIGTLLSICWLFPNTQEIMTRYQVALEGVQKPSWFQWRLQFVHAAGLGVLAVVCVMMMQKNSPFLYFQF